MIKDILDIPAFMRGKGQKYQAKELSSEVMMQELYNRGITISDLFGFYYTLEANGDGRLTIGDAQLAFGTPIIKDETPF